jgi:hypothetical protein
MSFAHTPYDGSKQPFTIGLEPLGSRDWIEPDEFLASDLTQKERLLAARRDVVARSEAGTHAAQMEVLRMLTEYLPRRYPQIYTRDGDSIHIGPAARSVAVEAVNEPLIAAARLVQEDLCVMRRSDEGWRLAAAVLCFPSSWSLAEKLGKNLGAIHAPVPGFAGRMESVVTRVFDNLRVGEPLARTNWSIYNDAELHHPPSEGGATQFSSDDDVMARAHIRVEPQTLTRLPETSDILFTIRVYVDPMARLRLHPRGRELAHSLRTQLLALNEAQADYKALTSAREKLARALDEIANAQ